MEKDNYYTPELNEFHPGFIYEHVLGTGKWVKVVCTEFSSFADSPHCLDLNKVRVKYLDRDCIESLGFKFYEKGVDHWFIKRGEFNMGTWTSYAITLQAGFHDHRVRIVADDRGEDEVRYVGTIKNKSELKVLLKQLGI